MPTDQQDDDKRLSDLLQQIEPPKSPFQLDELILKRAREKAEAQRDKNQPAGNRWFGNEWRSAIAVFSVAAIAISVSIQVYNNDAVENEVVRFEPSQAPAVESLNTGIEEQEFPADVATLALEQSVALDTSADNTAAAPTTVTRQAPEPERSQARALSSQAAPAIAGNQAELDDADLTRDAQLLALLASVLLNEEVREDSQADFANSRESQRDTLVQELIANYEALDPDSQAMSQAESSYTEQRNLYDEASSLPTSLQSAINELR